VSFIVAGGVLLLVLLIGAVFDADDETRENDPVAPYNSGVESCWL
jgi:hypothetical protein